MEYTKHGNNAALSIHVLDDAAMRALGFTDYEPCWHGYFVSDCSDWGILGRVSGCLYCP